METENLTETMKLERIEVNLFRGTTADNSPGRILAIRPGEVSDDRPQGERDLGAGDGDEADE